MLSTWAKSLQYCPTLFKMVKNSLLWSRIIYKKVDKHSLKWSNGHISKADQKQYNDAWMFRRIKNPN